MVKGGIRSRRNKKSKSKVVKTAKKIVARIRTNFARFRGKLIAYYAKYFDDEASKLQKKRLKNYTKSFTAT